MFRACRGETSLPPSPGVTKALANGGGQERLQRLSVPGGHAVGPRSPHPSARALPNPFLDAKGKVTFVAEVSLNCSIATFLASSKALNTAPGSQGWFSAAEVVRRTPTQCIDRKMPVRLK